jgi:hypothetical protein
MAYTSYTSALRRQFHHVRVNREGEEGYEPCMFILNPAKKGNSFVIPLAALWKYCEPIDNQDAYPSDLKEFQRIVSRALRDQKIAKMLGDSKLIQKAKEDIEGCAFASALWKENKILPCVGFNLWKMMCMFEIEPNPQAAAQLLLFVQDGLDELKALPPLPPEKELMAGEITIMEGSRKIVSKDLGITESDLIIEGGEA